MEVASSDPLELLGVCSAAPPPPTSFLASLPPGGGLPGMVTMLFPLVVTLALLLYTEPPSRAWHRALSKSPSAPPPAFHAVAWVVCLSSSGWAARLVLTAVAVEGGDDVMEDDVVLALGAFLVQVVITLSWLVAVFGMRRLLLGYAIMRASCVAVALCVIAFMRVSALAASLLVPYLGWLVFLTYLSGYLARNNPPVGAAKKVVPLIVGAFPATNPPSSLGGGEPAERRDVSALLRRGCKSCARSPSFGGDTASSSAPAPGAPAACSPVTPVVSAAVPPLGGLRDDRDPLASWDLHNSSPSPGRTPPATPEGGPSQCRPPDWPPRAAADVPPSPQQRGPSRPPHGAGGCGTDSSDGEIQEAGSTVTVDGDR